MMDAIEIFKKLVGERLDGLIVTYNPYTDRFPTYEYTHVNKETFEPEFVDVLFDGIVFYAYEKNEIESEFNKGRLNNLRQAARAAYENRIPKTEKETDGLLGELTLDGFIKLFFPQIEMLFSRVKYIERYPRIDDNPTRKGHEVKGYDGMFFSSEKGQLYFWTGQVKTGTWEYCLDGIKADLNKSLIANYFADSIVIMCDIMRSVGNVSKTLLDIIDYLNGVLIECSNDRKAKVRKIIEYFKARKIKIRIPCLLIPDEHDYENEEQLLTNVKSRIHDSFQDFKLENNTGIDTEVFILAFPVRNLKLLRSLFLKVRRQ